MIVIIEAVQLLSAACLGLFVGALLTEAVVLVPMWRSMSPPEFFDLHKAHAHRLYAFFAPLTAVATSLSIVAAISCVITDRAGSLAVVVAAALTLVILSTYFLYFQRANASFAEASMEPEHLPAELARWASWHWFRTAVGLIGFMAMLLSLKGIP